MVAAPGVEASADDGVGLRSPDVNEEGSIATSRPRFVRDCKPDGEWGWMITFGTFLVFVITTGSSWAFGILYIAFLDAFNQSKATTGKYTMQTAGQIVRDISTCMATKSAAGILQTMDCQLVSPCSDSVAVNCILRVMLKQEG